MNFKSHLEESIGNEIDKINFYRAFVVIKRYKLSGKYYMTEARNLTDEEITIINNNRGYELLNNFKKEGFIVTVEGYNLKGFFHDLLK